MRKPLSEKMAQEMLRDQKAQTEDADKKLAEFLKEMGYTDILSVLQRQEKSNGRL